jgi:hypothetical protein
MTHGAAAYRLIGLAAFIPRRGIRTQPRVEALRRAELYHRKQDALKEGKMTDPRAENQ